MSDSVGVWTLQAFKEHVDQRFISLERGIDTARHSVERAEDAAATTRLYAEQKSNEFRGQLSDQAGTFMPRAEADQRYATTMQAITEARINTQKMVDELRDGDRRSLDELRATMQKSIDESQHNARREISELRATTQVRLDEVRRIAYIAVGVGTAAVVAMPILLMVLKAR